MAERSGTRDIHNGSISGDWAKAKTTRRNTWKDLVTLLCDGLRPYIFLQKKMIDIMRIILFNGNHGNGPMNLFLMCSGNQFLCNNSCREKKKTCKKC